MKISRKEKLLLVMLVALLLGVVYYQFIYTTQNEKISALEVNKAEVQTEYDILMETIRTLEERQNKIEVYQSSIKTNSMPFYPTLVQEYLILEIDKWLVDNNIEGNISFTQVASSVVEPFANVEVVNPQSSLQPLVDEYNHLKTSETPIVNDTQTPVTQSTSATVEQMKLSLSFNATYSDLKAFISTLENYEREIVLTNLTVTPGINDQVSGSMNLEFYAFPKFSGVDDHYLNWSLTNTYGKETPFSGIGAQVGINMIENLGQEKKEQNNFVILLKSTTSELPTFMMGLENDSSQATYINSHNTQIEEVKLILTQEGDQYFYAYNNASQSYPMSGQKNTFTPDQDINIKVSSEARVTVDDLSGIRFTVVNNTDKKVNVIITNDDEQNPRIKVVGEGNPVNVLTK